jgi:HK97 family phage major capsid protein
MQVWEKSKEIADRAADENRQFTGEEQSSWVSLQAEMKAIDERIKAMLDGEQREADAAAAFDKLAGGKVEKANAPGAEGEHRKKTSVELRKFLRGEGGRAIDIMPPPIAEGGVETRVLSKLTAAAGLNVVPTDFYNRLVAHLIEVSAVLQASPTVLNTAGGESIQIPKTTAHSTGAAIVTEGNTIGGTDPTFGQLTLGAFKYGLLIQVSRELLSDEGVDVESYLAMQAGRAIGNAFGAHMVTGAGTTVPRGVVLDATLGKTGATTVVGVFSADDLIDLHYSVIAPYRASSSCYWLMKDASLATARKLKDTTGQYLWQPSLQVGAPDTILGKPVLTDPNVAATGLGNKSVVFGDFSQYFVRLAGGVRFERSDDFAFSTDLVTFRCLIRADAALVDLTGAVKYFAGGAS